MSNNQALILPGATNVRLLQTKGLGVDLLGFSGFTGLFWP
jgi:hypothetical protein